MSLGVGDREGRGGLISKITDCGDVSVISCLRM